MIEYLTLEDVEALHDDIINTIGGSHGIRDEGALKSAISQPEASFGGEDLYPSILEKAVALAFSLISNHPFVDGNKRTGYLALRVFLEINGYDVAGRPEDKERIILGVAAGSVGREHFLEWVRANAFEQHRL